MMLIGRVFMPNRSTNTIAHLILAAGSSSRMGVPKQLLPWGQTTLIGHAIQQSFSCKRVDIFVVLGANFDLISEEVNSFSVSVIHNTDWQKGMGGSISLGVEKISGYNPLYEAVLISLVDQPLLDASHLSLIINKYYDTKAPIVVSGFEGKNGVPAIFSNVMFDELRSLQDDYGARYIIKNNLPSIAVVNAGDKAKDIDTKKEYEELINKEFQE